MTDLAGRFGFVFYVIPGPSAGQNLAYWGPPKRNGVPQPALSVNMGPSTNVDQIGFTYEGLAATTVKDEVQVSDTNEKQQVTALASKREPPLASMPSPQFNQPNVRVSTLGAQQAAEGTAEPQNRGGMTSQQAKLLAQSTVDKSADKVVTATGELDSLRYGEILTPRGLVGLRGAGFLRRPLLRQERHPLHPPRWVQATFHPDPRGCGVYHAVRPDLREEAPWQGITTASTAERSCGISTTRSWAGFSSTCQG